ncbi:MAG: flagellar basal body protein [Hyphomicrobium sp.]|nr:flagellar basal body protein [Hyphomicrobium sp.]
MTHLNFYAIASQHADWVATRRTVIAANIANANTPGYRARDVVEFKDVLTKESFRGTDAATSMAAHGIDPRVPLTNANESARPVELDREMMKAGAVAREQSLNTALSKAFNRLLAMSIRS